MDRFFIVVAALVAAPLQAETHSELMTRLHNEIRAQAGLAPQAVDDNLTQVAQRWAETMAARGSMYHGGGEQIIAYSSGDTSYQAGFRLWQNSPPHRAWLFCRGPACGFGYAVGRNGAAYYAGAFQGLTASVATTASYSSTSHGRWGRRGRGWMVSRVRSRRG